MQIFISIDQQKLHLYSDGMHVADTSVATGVPSLPTPLGVFSVIQKQVFHRSNLYSNAPMPFMQRITWSGVALHEGESIGHRASHGCIRMPHDFAVRLYRLTKLGVPVVIAQPELKPAAFADPHLFVHRDKPPEPSPAAAPAVSAAAPAAGVALYPAPPVTAVAAGPSALGLRVNSDGNGAPSVALTPVADAAKSNPPIDDGPKPGEAAKPDATVPAAVSSVPTPPAEPADLVKTAPASRSPIAIFISRKEKKIYVRQDFAPLFQAPVTIADPDKPLGTLVFTALGFIGDGRTTLRWDVVSLPDEPPPEPKRKADRETRSDRYDRGRRHSEEREKLGRSAAAADARRGACPHRYPAGGDRLCFPTDRARLVADRVRPRSRRRNRRRHEFHRRHCAEAPGGLSAADCAARLVPAYTWPAWARPAVNRTGGSPWVSILR